MDSSAEQKRFLVEPQLSRLSIGRQCDLLGMSRSAYYYEPAPVSERDLLLMRLLDEHYTRCPFYGSRRMVAALGRQGEVVNRKHVVRLMQQMGLVAIYPREKTSQVAVGHQVYPYLLRDVKVDRVNQVWSTDITYIRLARGFVYLAAVIDWYSRYVLSWATSVTLDLKFCLEALEGALTLGCPQIFNTDQGSQFTSDGFTGRLKQAGIAISMDGRGRALDNIFVERLWRSVKYEEVYLNDYSCVPEAVARLDKYLRFYNTERPHQSLSYRTPAEIHWDEGIKTVSR